MAVVSKVDIANMALDHIGARSIIEGFDENSTQAITANRWYDRSRLSTLEAFNWSFARKRQELSLDSDPAPCVEFTYRYTAPFDMVVPRYIEQFDGVRQPLYSTYNYNLGQPDAIPFEMELSSDGERKTILTDMEQATLVYTADVSNVLLFTPGFIKAFSYALASDMAYKLTGKLSTKDDMYKYFVSAIREAAVSDANARVERAPRESEFIRGRA